MPSRVPVADLTRDEALRGFRLVETTEGPRVTKRLSNGLLAIKVRIEGARAVEYVVYGHDMEPLIVVRSLQELADRFG